MSMWNTIKVKYLIFNNFLNYVTRYNVQKFLQMPHIMFNWSQVKNKIIASLSEKNFQKLDVCVKHHKSENTLFSTIF